MKFFSKETPRMMLDMDMVKEILLFCKANQIHHIKLGSLEAHLVPDNVETSDSQPSPQSPEAADSALPNWVTME